ncbi:hypothetical protein ACIOWK_30045 [Pseudomonas protegens]|uniref:hypothetical protein n=1 Tax=Pseudomonas protegens TaxID=380021 RepID=UPI0037FF50A5
MNTILQAPTIEQWQALYDDQAAMIKSPENYQFALIQLAKVLRVQGVIDADGLSDLLEQADAAYTWGIEVLLNGELNGSGWE